MARYLAHSSHHHLLVRTQIPTQPFSCDLCQWQGTGVSYRCDACHFDLDERCAKLGESEFFLQHPGHNPSLDSDCNHPGLKRTTAISDHSGKGVANYLTHFSHHHQLAKTDQTFICDLCQYPGLGVHYRCNACDFDLHVSCATLPETISFFAHPGHHLRLASGASQSRFCDLCMQSAEGLFYRCIGCNFDVHPHCTTIQQVVRTALHPEHTLSLVAGVYTCTACGVINNGAWFYRCAICNVSLHVNCLHGPMEPNNGGQTEYRGYATNNSSATPTSKREKVRQFMLEVGNKAGPEFVAKMLLELFFPKE